MISFQSFKLFICTTLISVNQIENKRGQKTLRLKLEELESMRAMGTPHLQMNGANAVWRTAIKSVQLLLCHRRRT